MIFSFILFILAQDKLLLTPSETEFRYQELQKLAEISKAHPDTVIAYVESRFDSWERDHPEIYADLIIGASDALLNAHSNTDRNFDMMYNPLNRTWIIDTLESTSLKLDPLERFDLFLKLHTFPSTNPLFTQQRQEDALYIVQTLGLMIEHYEMISEEESKKPYQFFKPAKDYHGQPLSTLDPRLRKHVEESVVMDSEVWTLSAIRSNWKTSYNAARRSLMDNMIRLYSYVPANLEELRSILAKSDFDEDERQIIVNKVTQVHAVANTHNSPE